MTDPADNLLANCTICLCFFTKPNKAGLIAHGKTEKHRKNFEANRNCLSINKFFVKSVDSNLENKVARAELLLASFMAEHSTPFLQADHLVERCKKMFPDSEIAKNIKMKRSKASYVIQHGIAYYERQDKIQICKTQKFSIIIDKSTDISTTQLLAVVVHRYVSVILNINTLQIHSFI